MLKYVTEWVKCVNEAMHKKPWKCRDENYHLLPDGDDGERRRLEI